jgi:hypothetical protein
MSEENKLKTVQLFNASFSHEDWRNNISKAFDESYRQIFNSDPHEIYECAVERGNELLDRMRDETLKLNPKPNWVPWITFNFIRNAESEFNFLESVCNRVLCQFDDTTSTPNPTEGIAAISHLNLNSLIPLIILIFYYFYSIID